MKVWIICCSLGLSMLSGIYSTVRGGEAGVEDASALGSLSSMTQKFCVNFTSTTNEQGEFYSPFYPKTYRNNTDCIHLITAPKGHRIRIDFRDEFHIEDSGGCQYDYLELRNGPFGYSPKIGRYCGKNHPPMIDSASQYIWMRFQTDDIIQYSGFKAVYEFYPTEDPTNICRIDLDARQLELEVTSDMIRKKLDDILTGRPHLKEVDCTFVLNARTEQQIFLHWNSFKPADEVDCDNSFISVYEGTTRREHRTKKLCGEIAKDFSTHSNQVYLRVYAKTWQFFPSFNALVTVIHKGPCNQQTMFECGGDACVDKSLKCNGRVNCDDSRDELVCQDTLDYSEDDDSQEPAKKKPLMSTFHISILSVVGSVLLGIIVISTCVTCKQHQKEQQRRKHALQQERQAIEHEMTTLINSPRPGHLRSHMAAATQGKTNGTIPGTSSHSGNGMALPKSEMYRTTSRQHGGYTENHLSQTAGSAHNGGNGYTRYLKIKDKQDEGYLDQDVVIANKEHCDNSYISSDSGCLDRSRLRRTLSDKTNNHRSRTPSPRPDVVQVERIPPQHINHHSKHSRALSADRLLDRARYDPNDEQKNLHHVNATRRTPPPTRSECYLPYKCSETPGYGYNQGNCQDVGSRSHQLDRKVYDSGVYPALEYSPRLTHQTHQQPGGTTGQYVHLDPGYRTTVRKLEDTKQAPGSFCNPFRSEGLQSPPPPSIPGMYTMSGGPETASSASSGTYAHDIQEKPGGAKTSSFHSPAAQSHAMVAGQHPRDSQKEGNMLSLTPDFSGKVSRTPSIDYKQAPIVPERGSSSTSAGTSGSHNYASVQMKQGRTRKTDSPDIFYTRPKRSEIRHEAV